MAHDSLDLAALKERAEAIQKAAARRRLPWKYFLGGVAVIILLGFFSGLASLFSQRLSTQAEMLMQVLLWGGMFLAYPVYQGWWTYRQRKLYLTTLKRYAPEFVARPAMISLLGAFIAPFIGTAIVVLALGFPPLLPYGVALVAALFAYSFLYRRMLMWATQGGLPRVERLLRLLPGNSYLLNLKSIFLLHKGQLDEAERIFRELLARKRGTVIYNAGLLLNNLGYCLTLAERYAEALPVLEAALQIAPELAHLYDSLASWYLEQNLDPERALELTEMAVELPTPDALGSQPIRQATSARALALTGRDTRAEAMLEQALSAADKLKPYMAAEAYRQAGYARRAQGDHEAAEAYFKRAVSLDPDGLYGGLARRALDKENSSVLASP